MNELELHKEKSIDRKEDFLPPSWLTRHTGVLKNLISNSSRFVPSTPDGYLRRRLIELIDSAKDIVCASSFLLADSEIISAFLRAGSQGKRVYLLTASEIQLKNEPRIDNEFDQERLQDHLRMMQELAGRVLVRTGENFHSKFLIVDPHSKEARGFLLTANLTTEALMRNVELGIELNSIEARDLYLQFLTGFWQESSNELLEPGSLNRVTAFNGVYGSAPSQVLCTTGRVRTLRENLLELIKGAKTEIIVSTFGIHLQHEVAQQLISAVKSGRKVKVLARPRANKATMDALLALVEAGAEVRGHPWLHAKCLLVDTEEGWEGLVMTSNIEPTGLDKGFESGILIRGNDAANLHLILEDWWESFPQTLSINKKVGDVMGDLLVWQNETLTKISIQEKSEENLGKFEAESFDDMESLTPELASRASPEGNALYHENVFRWTVLPPKLPANAEKVDSDGDISVYKLGNELYVAIERKDQLSKARKLATDRRAKIAYGPQTARY